MKKTATEWLDYLAALWKGSCTMRFWFISLVLLLWAVWYAAFACPCPATLHRVDAAVAKSQARLVQELPPVVAADYTIGFGASDEVDVPEAQPAVEATAEDAEVASDVEAAGPSDSPKAADPATPPKGPTYLIYFTATWCGPCQVQKPVILEMQKAGEFDVRIVDIDREPQIAANWGVQTVPQVATVVNGVQTYRGVGPGHTRAFLESKLGK